MITEVGLAPAAQFTGANGAPLAQFLAAKTKHRIEEVARRLDGHVIAWIDLTGLLPSNQRIDAESVLSLNGIAYDPRHDRLFVTGKQWPTVFELKVIQHTRGTSHSPQKPFPIAKRGLESPVSTKVSRIWNLMMSFFVSCQLTMDRDDTTIV
jgi:hypothetical protein